MDDDKYQQCLDQIGHFGGIIWFNLMALMSQQYKGDPSKTITIYARRLQKSARVSRQNLEKTLRKLGVLYNFSPTFVGENIEIYYPKFLEKQQKYSVSLGEAGFHRLAQIEEEVEVEREVKKERDLISSAEVDKKSKESKTKARKKFSRDNGNSVSAFIGFWISQVKAYYNSDCPRTGKFLGTCKRIVKDLGTAKAMDLAEAYFKMRDKWFLTKQHDITTFEQNINKVQTFLDTGQSMTGKIACKIETEDFNERQKRELLESEAANDKG